MDNVNKTKNKAKITAILLSLATVLIVAGISTSLATLSQSASAQKPDLVVSSSTGDEPKAPMAASEDGGNNVYVVWWTNKSGNWEVMFRASNDGGATFGERINLSNSTDAESQTAEILAVGEDSVFVSWWETNAETGSSESVLRVSTDGGETFGPMIMLGMNGTISTTAVNATGAAEGEETVEEEAE